MEGSPAFHSPQTEKQEEQKGRIHLYSTWRGGWRMGAIYYKWRRKYLALSYDNCLLLPLKTIMRHPILDTRISFVTLDTASVRIHWLLVVLYRIREVYWPSIMRSLGLLASCLGVYFQSSVLSLHRPLSKRMGCSLLWQGHAWSKLLHARERELRFMFLSTDGNCWQIGLDSGQLDLISEKGQILNHEFFLNC